MRDPIDMLPLRPVVFGVLLALSEGELHGYGIMKRVNERLGTRALLGPGTLYRTLKELRAEELIAHAPCGADNRSGEGDGRRRYYRLTPWGRRVAAAEATRLATLVEMARGGNLIQ